MNGSQQSGYSDELKRETKYKVGDKTFVVSPAFQDTGKETLATILLRLMRSDVDDKFNP